MGCGPGSENGSGKEAEADEAEVEGLGAPFFVGFGGAGGVECVVDAFDSVAQVAGDEGGVEGEPVDAAEAGDLEGGDVGDDRGEGYVGEAWRHPAQGKESENFEGYGDARGAVAARAQVAGGGDSGEEAQNGDEMGNDSSPLIAGRMFWNVSELLSDFASFWGSRASKSERNAQNRLKLLGRYGLWRSNGIG